MHRAIKLHWRIPKLGAVVVLRVTLSRGWLAEAVIVALMLVLLLAEIVLRVSVGAHRVGHVVIGALLFGLIGMWVHVNGAELAAWEQQDTQERERHDERI